MPVVVGIHIIIAMAEVATFLDITILGRQFIWDKEILVVVHTTLAMLKFALERALEILFKVKIL